MLALLPEMFCVRLPTVTMTSDASVAVALTPSEAPWTELLMSPSTVPPLPVRVTPLAPAETVPSTVVRTPCAPVTARPSPTPVLIDEPLLSVTVVVVVQFAPLALLTVWVPVYAPAKVTGLLSVYVAAPPLGVAGEAVQAASACCGATTALIAKPPRSASSWTRACWKSASRPDDERRHGCCETCISPHPKRRDRPNPAFQTGPTRLYGDCRGGSRGFGTYKLCSKRTTSCAVIGASNALGRRLE